MGILSTVGAAGMGALHGYILVLEMFLWTQPRGRKAFGMTADYAEKTKSLAANMGLYNGFLAAGLSWSLVHPNLDFARQLRFFFLGCISVAGLFGAVTANRRILFVQAVPALISLSFVALDL